MKDRSLSGIPIPSGIFSENRRETPRAVSSIFSLDDFAHIFDTFPIVARKDIAEFGEYRTKRLCLEAYDHVSPETLRKLELQVREIELALRRTIVRALDGDVDALPSHIKSKLLDECAKHSPNGDATPTLRTLLDSSYLTDLEKIIRSDGVWTTVSDQFGARVSSGDSSAISTTSAIQWHTTVVSAKTFGRRERRRSRGSMRRFRGRR
ncbi:MAG: hypothetical protein ACR2OE_13390 [Thermomicrobiales bacterium]